MQPHILRAAENSPAITLGAGATTAVFWGLHVSEICMILSTLATVCGLGLQVFLAFHRIRRLEKGSAASIKVISALTQTNRDIATKVDNITKSGD